MRLLIFRGQSNDEEEFVVALVCALYGHRIMWIPLLVLSFKWPLLCRFHLFYETIALVLESAIAFEGAEDC